MSIILKERNNEKHFISKDKNLAYAFACYYTKPCGEYHYINGEKRLCKIFFDTAISITKQNGEVIEFKTGDYFVTYNEKQNIKSVSELKYLKDLRKQNKLSHYYICVSNKQFLNIEQ